MNQKANFAQIFCLSHIRAFENFLIKKLASTEMLEMQSNSKIKMLLALFHNFNTHNLFYEYTLDFSNFLLRCEKLIKSK